jgi:calcineurin-like phosphoesterase family protein
MGRLQDTLPYIERLKGKKVLTCGNHDSGKTRKALKKLGWAVVNSIVVNDTLIQHHYMTAQHDFERVLHGHAHGSHSQDLHIDVGVDAHHFGTNFEPIRGTSLLGAFEEYALMVILNNLLSFGTIEGMTSSREE